MRSQLSRIVKNDRFAGMVLISIGLFAVIYAQNYRIGSLSNMQAGFFPIALGVILCVLGAVLVFTGGDLSAEPETEPANSDSHSTETLTFEWRGWTCIFLGFAAFIVVLEHAGMIPATTALVVISALGERKNTIWSALGIAVVMNLFVVVVFKWALNMSFQLFVWG